MRRATVCILMRPEGVSGAQHTREAPTVRWLAYSHHYHKRRHGEKHSTSRVRRTPEETLIASIHQIKKRARDPPPLELRIAKHACDPENDTESENVVG